jgi:hypothetical protein
MGAGVLDVPGVPVVFGGFGSGVLVVVVLNPAPVLLVPAACLVAGAVPVCDALFSQGESLFSQGESPDSSCADNELAKVNKITSKKQNILILFKIYKQGCV